MLHVPCKHCGQTVEVQDLLAAAEQACPHCGQPLLDDAPSTLPTAAAPGQQLGLPTQGLGRGCIVISRADAQKMPPMVCIVCGSTATHAAKESFQTLDTTIVRYFVLLVPYCDRHYRKYWRWTIASWVIFLVLALWLLYPHAMGLTAVPPMTVFAVVLAGTLIFLLVYSRSRHVGFAAYEDRIEVSGASAQYVIAMQELQARRLDDVP
jgi:hypothetical protein